MRATSEINSRCTRCGACLEECPNQAIVPGLVTFAIDKDFCDGHGNCIAVCPEGAAL
ncbi:4Fe-4S dicluster domain-containing protein [bacterium]|nr:4Fe-4S dicluster domain-containing protein [bacterium]